MPETLEKTKPPTTERDAGRKGTSSPGDAVQASGAEVPVVLSREDFRLVGGTLNGKHWQADIASLVGVSKSQVTRYLNGERDLNPLTARHLQYVLVERIEQIIALLDVPGMPHAGTAQSAEVIEKIKKLMTKVPGQEPPRAR